MKLLQTAKSWRGRFIRWIEESKPEEVEIKRVVVLPNLREEFFVIVLSEVIKVLEDEKINLPTMKEFYHPDSYVIFINDADERNWRGKHKQELIKFLNQETIMKAIELAKGKPLSTVSIEFNFMVDPTFEAGKFMVKVFDDENEKGIINQLNVENTTYFPESEKDKNINPVISPKIDSDKSEKRYRWNCEKVYLKFYGLETPPFNLTPDPNFIVFTPNYNEVLAGLYSGLENAKGLIVLTGEAGTGKTTALRWLLRRLDSSILAAYVFNPRLSIDEFYHHVSQMLGIRDCSNKTELLNEIGRFLEARHAQGLRTILIIDQAHKLSDYVLEEIRLLLNFESDNAKHLQIVLTGQPELREKLNQPNLRQIKQCVALRCQMHPLPNLEAVELYITERLLIAGREQPNIFTPAAIDLIFQNSEGIPHQINNLCDNSMLSGYASSEQIIGRQIVEEVVKNLDLIPHNFDIQENEKTLPKYSRRVLTDEAQEEL